MKSSASRSRCLWLLTLILLTSCLEKQAELGVLPVGDTVVVDELKVQRGNTSVGEQLFTGLAYAVTEEGDTLVKDFYVNGKLHGLSQAWYANGQVQHERTYEHGKKVGQHQGWWSNGQRKFQYSFQEDEYHGEVKEWYENGMPYRQFTYEAGYEEGPQKMWRSDGKLYANYVVKNKRIYGLSGRKVCKSLWKG